MEHWFDENNKNSDKKVEKMMGLNRNNHGIWCQEFLATLLISVAIVLISVGLVRWVFVPLQTKDNAKIDNGFAETMISNGANEINETNEVNSAGELL